LSFWELFVSQYHMRCNIRPLTITLHTSFWRNRPLLCFYISTLSKSFLLTEGEPESFWWIDCLVVKRGIFLPFSLWVVSHSQIHISTHELLLSDTLWFHLANVFVPLHTWTHSTQHICKAASLLTLTSHCLCFLSSISRVAPYWEALCL
jgi:hypothetical protein